MLPGLSGASEVVLVVFNDNRFGMYFAQLARAVCTASVAHASHVKFSTDLKFRKNALSYTLPKNISFSHTRVPFTYQPWIQTTALTSLCKITINSCWTRTSRTTPPNR